MPLPPEGSWPASLKALWDLYGATGGNAWANRDFWLSNDEPCGLCDGCEAWWGVTCTSGASPQIESLDLRNNTLSIPLGGVLPTSVQKLCFDPASGVDCHGFPPHSCAVFGASARLSADPKQLGVCLSCEGMNKGLTLLMLVIAVVTGGAAAVRYIHEITKTRTKKDFQGWIATASIVLHSLGVIFVLSGMLVVEFAAPLIAKIVGVIQVIFLDIGAARPECLLPQGMAFLPYLVAGMMLGLPIFVLAGVLIAAVRAKDEDKKATRFKVAVTLFTVFFDSIIEVSTNFMELEGDTYKTIGAMLFTLECVGVLLLLHMYYVARKKATPDERLKYLTHRFKDDSDWWQFVFFFHKILSQILISALNTLPQEQSGAKIAIAVLYLMLYCAVYVKKKGPYEHFYQNFAAVTFQAMSLIILIVARAIEGKYGYTEVYNAMGEDSCRGATAPASVEAAAEAVFCVLLFTPLLVQVYLLIRDIRKRKSTDALADKDLQPGVELTVKT